MSALPSHVHAGATRSIVVTNPAASNAPVRRARRGRIADSARLFAEAGSRLLSSLDADAATTTLLQLAVPAFADWCGVYLLDERGPYAVGKTAVATNNAPSGAVSRKISNRQVVDSHKGVLDILRTGYAELFPNVSDGLLAALVEHPGQRAQLRRSGAVSAMVVPIVGGTATIGAACMIAPAPQAGRCAYSRGDFETAQRLGQMVGQAVVNARRFAAMQHRPVSRLHAVVSALRQRASAVIDPEILVSEAVNGMCAALDADASAYLEYDPAEQRLLLKDGVGWSPGLVGAAVIDAFPGTFSGYSLSTSDPVVIADGRSETRFTISNLLRQQGIVSGVAVSIRDRGLPIGVLGVYSRRRRHFSPVEESFVKDVAEILGSEIGRGTVENEVRSLKGELHSILGGIGDAVLVQDPRGQLIYANASAARTLEASSIASLLATPAHELFTRFEPAAQVAKGTAGESRLPWARALGGETVADGSMTYRPGGTSEPRSLTACSRPVLDDHGQVQRVITIFQDAHAADHTDAVHPVTDHADQVDVDHPDLVAILEAERRRVAYDIHDGLAQIATSAYQHLEAFADRHHSLSPEEHAELEQMRELTRRTVREARRVIAELRPTVLDDFGLVVALRDEIEELRKAGWLVIFNDPADDQRLPRNIEIGLFRVAQEALANARKHAGPTPIWVSLERDDATVRLEVRDQGKGFDTHAPAPSCMAGERVGLVGMNERMALLGGACIVASNPGEGTRVIAVVPVEPLSGEGV